MNDIEICNGRIDFKFVLKQSSYIIVYGKNTFGAIADQQKCENTFPEFFCNVCRSASAHLYGDGDMIVVNVTGRMAINKGALSSGIAQIQRVSLTISANMDFFQLRSENPSISRAAEIFQKQYLYSVDFL